uniref:Receptor-type tyrosine-protein phosphatase-like N n=1 Tax=Esox lucius TaxID=8010 RepID=A0A3P8Y8U8_ESOLU
MGSQRLWRVLCLITVFCQMGMSSKYGCLFEKKLCPRDQSCSDDGLFGQCRLPQQERIQYEVSVTVLHKLQEVLKDLMMQGLSWQDDITQYIIGKELSRVPQTHPPYRAKGEGDNLNPDLMQRYLDYMIMDPPRSSQSLHMQTLDPYSYRQDNEERSLNSLEGGGFPHTSSHSVGKGSRTQDRDRQVLQDLVSLYLSSPTQPVSPNRGAAAPLSTSPFYQELDFPLDYTEDYISQQDVEVRKQHEQTEKKTQKDYGSLAGLDGECALRMSMTHKVDKASISLPEQPPVPQASPDNTPAAGAPPSAEGASGKEPRPTALVKTEKQRKKGTADGKAQVQEEYGYIVTNQSHLSRYDGVRLLELLAERIHLSAGSFINISVVGPALTFRVRPNSQNLSADGVADKAVAEKNFLESETDLKILQTGVGERADGLGLPTATRIQDGSRWVFMTMVVMACVGGILVATMTVACLRRHANRLASEKLGLGPEGGSVTHQEYQDLCRQHMASKGTGSVGGSGGTDTSRVSSVSSQFSDAPQPSPSSHSSTPSWCEEPAQSNMDISTGHMILAYMEDHLKNKDRLLKEWEALCSYQAEPSTVSVAQSESNLKKNRCPDSVPYDHSRVKMKAEMNPSRTDYINASTIIEHDPRMPAYIATQGPLSHTISDFWQMVWENGCTVIVMMTALVEDGEKQCDRYWPDEGSSLYHIYEVNLVSEHIWCNDFLVRSFYLKNVQTQETRTLTQFHFLSWPAQGIPSSTRTLLDFRRKVNKCYRGRSCPIIVHCSDGTGRTGTYILIDMVLNRMAKGVKEIDIAATLEHVRDQRPGMVRTKDQFEFALTAVAEEVNAILKALPQ